MNDINPLWILVVSSFIALLPIIFGIATSYLKISIVLSLFRSSLGTQQVPSGLIIMLISISATLFIMQPVFKESSRHVANVNFSELNNSNLEKTYEVFQPALAPWKKFIKKHAGKKELDILNGLQLQNTSNHSGEGLIILLTAFLLTEVKEGFQIGFIIMLPFLIIDLVVANILAGLGMYMVSPIMISLPLKILTIVALDAWLMIFKSLFMSYV